MAFDEQTKQAAKRLADALTNYGAQPSMFDVGITEEYGRSVFIVHLNYPNMRLSIPETWEGFSVRSEYIRSIRPTIKEKRFG